MTHLKTLFMCLITIGGLLGCDDDRAQTRDSGIIDLDASVVSDMRRDLDSMSDSEITDPIDAGFDEPDHGPLPINHRIEIEISSRPIAEVSDLYLSFAIDASLVVGGQWWSPDGEDRGGVGGDRVEPLDWSDERLRELTAPLAPAILRIGGTEADHIYYDLEDTLAEAPEGYDYRLTGDQWRGLTGFVADLDLSLMFTLNFASGPRDAEGLWTRDQAQVLMASEGSALVSVWELGNELNGYPLFHSINLSPDQLSQDLTLARELRDELSPTSKLAGPACAYWPEIGEINPISGDFIEAAGDLDSPGVDVVTWHYYPMQSRRCPVANVRATPNRLFEPDRLIEVERWATHTQAQVDAHLSGAEVWLGETGHAQCGGEPKVSDTFLSSVWWLDQLGRVARMGQPVMIRQALWGGTYGLIDEQSGETRPDYWASLAWKQMMGSTVLNAQVINISTDPPSASPSESELIAVYAHCHPVRGLSLLVINPTDERYQLDPRLDHMTTLLSSDAEVITLTPDPLSALEDTGDLPAARAALRAEALLWNDAPPTLESAYATATSDALESPARSLTLISWPTLDLEACE